MENQVANVPIALLLSPDLSPAAKVVWMIASLRSAPEAGAGSRRGCQPDSGSTPAPGTIRTGLLVADSGLSRPTVLTALAQLKATGWGERTAHASAPSVPVPGLLLRDHRLAVTARLLYGHLLITPGFKHPSGRFTNPQLAEQAQISPTTLAKALDQLVRAEWLKLNRAHRLAPTYFELTFPGFERSQALLADAQRRLGRATYFGEGLMREYLSLLVDSDHYEDDAAPGFLVNPRTGERLELDRFYPPSVAFEFQGPQHFRATGRFSGAEVAGQRERDLIKLGLCVSRGITLVGVLPEHLTLQGMRDAVGRLLPLRELTGYDLVIDYLETESKAYRRAAARF